MGMKKTGKLMSIILSAILLLSLSACGEEEGTSSAASPIQAQAESSESTVSAPEESSSALESSAPSESSASETAGSSAESEVTKNIMPDVDTGNEQFQNAFAENAIDQQYNWDFGNAASVSTMIQISNETANKWRYMVDAAYESVMGIAAEGDREAIKNAQDEWVNGLDAKLQQIRDEGDTGDSAGALDVSTQILMVYRDRTAELCSIQFALNGTLPSFEVPESAATDGGGIMG